VYFAVPPAFEMPRENEGRQEAIVVEQLNIIKGEVLEITKSHVASAYWKH
jgi:hypothetical protein